MQALSVTISIPPNRRRFFAPRLAASAFVPHQGISKFLFFRKKRISKELANGHDGFHVDEGSSVCQLLQSIGKIQAADLGDRTVTTKLKNFTYVFAEGAVIEQQTTEIF
jgi:hypothetical protein